MKKITNTKKRLIIALSKTAASSPLFEVIKGDANVRSRD